MREPGLYWVTLQPQEIRARAIDDQIDIPSPEPAAWVAAPTWASRGFWLVLGFEHYLFDEHMASVGEPVMAPTGIAMAPEP